MNISLMNVIYMLLLLEVYCTACADQAVLAYY